MSAKKTFIINYIKKLKKIYKTFINYKFIRNIYNTYKNICNLRYVVIFIIANSVLYKKKTLVLLLNYKHMFKNQIIKK